MADTALDVIKAIIVRLGAVTAVTNLVGNDIYTTVPQQSKPPYIVLSIDSDDYSTKTSSDMMHILRVQAFSLEDGISEALEIRAAVVEALDRQEDNITITGHKLIRIQKSSLNTAFPEPDGKGYQSVVQFELVVQT